MKDQLKQSKSKKWVDYSDSDSSEEHSHQHTQNHKPQNQQKVAQPKQQKKKVTYIPSKEQVNVELDKLDDLKDNRVNEVWLDIYSQNIDYLEEEMSYLRKRAKKRGDIVSVYACKEKERYEIKVYINVAYDYIEKGYDDHDYIKVTVASRNFQKGKNSRNPPLRTKQNLKEDNREQWLEAKEAQKRKYVDKQTGKPPEVSLKPNESATLERKYTKEEIEKKGQMIGEFRNKQPKIQEKIVMAIKQIQEPKEKQQIKKVSQTQTQKVEGIKKQQKSAQVKKQKEAKKQKKPKNKMKSQNPFEDLLDL